MLQYLLDTNIVSFSLRGFSQALDLRFVREPQTNLAISTITEAELLYGAAKKPAEARIHKLIAAFLPTATILPWTSACAGIYGTLLARLEDAGRRSAPKTP